MTVTKHAVNFKMSNMNLEVNNKLVEEFQKQYDSEE